MPKPDKITALVRYKEYQKSGDPFLDDFWKEKAKIVTVEDLEQINDMFENLTNVEILLCYDGDTNYWNDNKVIDFVNFYLGVKKIDAPLENQYILESFKNGDSPEKWHK